VVIVIGFGSSDDAFHLNTNKHLGAAPVRGEAKDYTGQRRAKVATINHHLGSNCRVLR
jgi:hypothetical protein